MTRLIARFATALALVATTGAANPVPTEPVHHFTAGAWTGAAHVDAATGQFTHCVASADYKNGIRLLFSLDGGENWNLGLANRDWSLHVGSEHAIQYKVDRREVRRGTAVAVSSVLARVSLPIDSTLFRQMRRGQTLYIAAGDDVMSFDLTASNRMLTELAECYRTYKDTGRDAANPFGGGDATLVGQPGANRQREAHDVAAQIMDRIGVDFAYVDPAAQPDLYERYDAVWKMNTFIGSLWISDNPNPAVIDASLTNGEEDKCDGTFQTQIKQDVPQGDAVVRRITACIVTDGSTWSSSFTTYPRAGGGHYVLQVFTSVSELSDALLVADALADAALLDLP